MKSCFLILIALFSISSLFAQENVNASGGDAGGSGGSAAYSVGQVVYTTLNGSGGTVNQGVQQPFEIFILSSAETFADIDVSAFPNPTEHRLNIKAEDFESLYYQLFDINGRLISENNIYSSITALEMSEYVSGVYILKISKDGRALKSFKIIKK